VAYKYDVAISFLSCDEGLARELTDILAPNLRVFLYTLRQEDLAGTDGLVTFREVFLQDSRLVVVLFRDGWGETRWTRVESEAITDRFLKEGPSFLFFIMTDPASVPPRWVPDKLIRFNLEDYGIGQAAGAIKLRVQELGGALHRETLADRARRAQEREQFQGETELLRRSERGVKEVQEEAARLVCAVQRLAAEAIQAAPRLGIQSRAIETAVGIRSARVSASVELFAPYINSLNDTCVLARVLAGSIILPGENRFYLKPPKLLREQRYEPDRVQGRGWCWRDAGGRFFSSTEVADELMQSVISVIEDSSR